jgi:hypothetical protein
MPEQYPGKEDRFWAIDIVNKDTHTGTLRNLNVITFILIMVQHGKV